MSAELFRNYRDRYENYLEQIAGELQDFLAGEVTHLDRIDRVTARAKQPVRFIEKSERKDDNGKPKYSDPLMQIQDQIGARVVTYYLSDVVSVRSHFQKHLRFVEAKELVPESDWQFGYFGFHIVAFLPDEVLPDKASKQDYPDFFELQIKTLMQNAWAEAEHDLAYKPQSGELTADQKRKFAFTSAQAWGADLLFEELSKELMSGKPEVPSA